MKANPIALTIRAKKLGVLIRDARLAAGKDIDACARAIGISPEAFEAYELGVQSPSLPELELLAYTLDIPLDHFWGDRARTRQQEDRSQESLVKLVLLRQKIIGALLKKARLEAGLSLEDLAEQASLPAEKLAAYELGEAPVPVPELEALGGLLDRSVRDFQDRHGPVGSWAKRQQAMENFLNLPEELQLFVGKPVNQPFLELAQRLSEMDVNKLRAVAEGLLEITY